MGDYTSKGNIRSQDGKSFGLSHSENGWDQLIVDTTTWEFFKTDDERIVADQHIHDPMPEYKDANHLFMLTSLN